MTETAGYRRIKATSLNFVNAMKIGDQPGIYRKEEGGSESFYGSYHASQILSLFGELQKFPEKDLDSWSDYFSSNQSEFGFFTNKPELKNKVLTGRELDPVWHYTRGNIWAFRTLNRKPEKDLSFVEPFLDPDYLYQYIKSYEWSNSWASGNQILGLATALMAYRDWQGVNEVDEVMEKAMYPALEELIDPHTGFWGTQLGADLPNGLFGTIHITPVYFAQQWPLNYLKQNVDSTLSCQLPDGSYWPGGSDCPDFDGAFMISNLYELTDYRREEMVIAARKLLDHLLMHEDPEGFGWLLHRRNSKPSEWKPRPHFIWQQDMDQPIEELRDEDPDRTHIMLGSWFYPLSITLISHMLKDTGYEGPYQVNGMSLHQSNVFTL